ncbi:oligosaccharide flippase family protein [Thiohalobacter thiocyanaticus]|uniref:oligosaccharide flippase family protein n=1 Tax=Thiohalobacter thiocyanaticus TaxID=585455 RepID=UPI000BBB2FCC|nr:oligosaccharide flippase family protein [Thiohalobacter thiocyanaticus]
MSYQNTKKLTQIALLGLSLVGGAGLTFISQALFARTLSPAEYGSLAAAFAVTRVLSPIASFGISEFWLARFGQEGWGAIAWVKPSLETISFTILIALFLGGLWAWFGASDKNTSIALILLLPMVAFQSLTSLAVARYQLEERYNKTSLWAMIPHVPRLIAALSAAWLGLGLMGVASMLAAIYALLLAIPVLIIYEMAAGRLLLVGHGVKDDSAALFRHGTIRDILSNAKWFAASGVFYVLHYQLAIVFLEVFSGPESAAIYSVAFVVLSAVFLIPTILYRWYMMPKMHRWAWGDSIKLNYVFQKSLYAVLSLSLIIIAAIVVVSPWVMPFLFGSEYDKSVLVLQLLSPAIFFRFLAVALGALMVGKGIVRKKVVLDIYGTSIGLILGVVLIREFSVIGGVVTTIAIEAMLVLLYCRALYSRKRHL